MMLAQVNMNQLAEFIEEKRNAKHFSIRQFADLINVSHVTIVNYLSANPPVPTLDFLEKLALGTNTDLCVLVALIKPDATRVNARAQGLADRIGALPADRIALIEDILRGWDFKPGNDSL